MQEINGSLPSLVFFSRILNVTLGTLHIILLGKGKRLLPPLLGFVEVFIWIVVVSYLVQSILNLACYQAYAAVFPIGSVAALLICSASAI